MKVVLNNGDGFYSRTILIHMKLDNHNFEEYYCPNKTIVGVNMLNFLNS